MIVIFHGNCYDGWGAAWVAQQFNDKAVLIPVVHGDSLPEIPDGEDVFMIDIVFDRATLEKLAARVNLVVLDHHKTAEAELRGFPNSVFDMTKSGARLAWEQFFPGLKVPKLIAYVEDRDLWRFALPDSQAVNAYIESYGRNTTDWNFMAYMIDKDYQSVLLQGNAILRQKEQRIDDIVRGAQWVPIGGHLVPVVNTGTFFSESAARLCIMYPDAKFSGYYFDRSDGTRQWGLRSTGFDVSEVAKLYGGGGHQKASGFQTKTPSVLEV